MADPTTVPNLRLWLKADSIATSVVDVSSWGNSAPGFTTEALTQGTAAKQPVRQGAVLNGLPGVYFNGDDGLVATDALLDLFRNLGGATVFAVVRHEWPTSTSTAVVVAGPLYFSSGSSAAQARALLQLYGDTANTAQDESVRTGGRRLDADGFINNPAAVGAWPRMTWKVGTGVFAWTNALTQIYLDGGFSVERNPWQTAGLTSDTRSLGGAVGSNPAATAEFLLGTVTEILVYQRTLTAAERAEVHTYLSDRYAITVADYVAPVVTGAGAGTSSASGSGAGSPVAAGGGAGTASAAGAGTGVPVLRGAGAATGSASGSGTGSSVLRGTGSGTANATAAGAGSAVLRGIGAATATVNGAGTGTAPSLVASGIGAGTAAVSGSGVGASVRRGSGNATAAATGVGAGTTVLRGNGAGTATVNGTGTGAAAALVPQGTGAATTQVTGSGTGRVVGTGAGSATASVTAAGAGTSVLAGTGIGSVTVNAAGTGRGITIGRGTGAASVSGAGAGVALELRPWMRWLASLEVLPLTTTGLVEVPT